MRFARIHPAPCGPADEEVRHEEAWSAVCRLVQCCLPAKTKLHKCMLVMDKARPVGLLRCRAMHLAPDAMCAIWYVHLTAPLSSG